MTLHLKLKAPAGCDLFHIPSRLPWMHWQTCERLASALVTEHRRHGALFWADSIRCCRDRNGC